MVSVSFSSSCFSMVDNIDARGSLSGAGSKVEVLGSVGA